MRGNLRTYNTRHLESRDERRYAAFSADDAGVRSGGIIFTEFGNWLEIDYLWVDEARRGRGIGSRLLREALDHARNRGCTHALNPRVRGPRIRAA
ncbi:MAG: GNAT family N-acetyltransferase, partial [Spirochaetales bacterium]|nr:GNAT family N-acetyltransferase [Spirochaetales bacterium]